MKKIIIVTTAITACIALCAIVWPQAETVEVTPILDEIPTVTTPQPTLPEPEEVVLTATTEKEMVETHEAEPALGATSEEPDIPMQETEKQAETEREPAPPVHPELIQAQSAQPEPEVMPEPEQEASDSNLENMVYVEGFGWIESQGPNHVEYAEDMYENGNKIGSMG
mgnify:CR=1 FL=1